MSKALQVRKYNRIGETQKELGSLHKNLKHRYGWACRGPTVMMLITIPMTKLVKVLSTVSFTCPVKALQEAMTRIETLETKVTALEAGE